MSRHLVVPDPHAHPDFSNIRFDWLAQLIIDLKPDHVICLGDFGDLPSLCSYDKGTKGFEGRRYKKDLAAVHDALEKIISPLKSRKKKLPKFWMLDGNHEERISRAINSDPAKLEGIISMSDLLYKEFGWEVVPYFGSTPGVVEIDGIAYAHYFTSGIMGRPISGLHPAYQILAKQFQSGTQGHVHTTDYAVRTRANGTYVQGLVAGVYADYFMDYAGDANNQWWRGIVLKENVNNGVYDPRFISMHSIKKEYRDG